MDERRYMVRIKRGDCPIMDYDLLTCEQAYSLYDMCLKYEDCGEEFIHATIYDRWSVDGDERIEDNWW